MNYELKFEEIVNKINKDKKPTLLIHACCAPCSSSVLERLQEYFEITILFYNPNITEEKEYEKRYDELVKFVSNFPLKNTVKVLKGNYEKEKFLKISKGLENEEERGKRCYLCYELRLEETAKIAELENYDYFATTLTLSPYKKTDWINEIGENLTKKYTTNYLYSDFKKKNGYKRSIELSKKYNLYRQDYCGCIFSKIERNKRNEENR